MPPPTPDDPRPQRGTRYTGSSLPKGVETVIGSIADHFSVGNTYISKKEFHALCFSDLVRSSTGIADDLWRALFNEMVLRKGRKASQATFNPQNAEALLIRLDLPTPGSLARTVRRQALLGARRAMGPSSLQSASGEMLVVLVESRSSPVSAAADRPLPTPSALEDPSAPPQPEGEETDESEEEEQDEPSTDEPAILLEERVAKLRRDITELEALKAEVQQEIDAALRELQALSASLDDLEDEDGEIADEHTGGEQLRPWEDMGMDRDEYDEFIRDLLPR